MHAGQAAFLPYRGIFSHKQPVLKGSPSPGCPLALALCRVRKAVGLPSGQSCLCLSASKSLGRQRESQAERRCSALAVPEQPP